MRDNYQRQYFVSAASVAAELHKAMLVARDISLTASNARALALRAGHGAAGFRALTEFIDELARKTVSASKEINAEAIEMSRTASDIARARNALDRFQLAYKKGEGAPYLHTIDHAYTRTKQRHGRLEAAFRDQIYQLTDRLNELGRELRTATVLAAMSRVEASASGKAFEDSLNVIAENVAQAAEKIQLHVRYSQRLFGDITLH
ncbi:chemotaxis protein [Teredinibacter haidensis]|uniref:chemotaxis protein n=1 Tax=Teredinibacter haidensis TaxID=2731755 RepID=UPI000948BBF5|nr:chemotaxis protein [Teredinibacter haidensis]